MPNYNRFHFPHPIVPAPQIMQTHGPVLSVEISVPTSLANYLNSQNQPIPSPISGVALIDTGAQRTCVDRSIITQLGVAPVGTVQSGTAAGQTTHNVFPSHFRFPNESLDGDLAFCVGVDLTGQTAHGQPIIALIGRDLLSNWVLIYNGPAGMFTVSV